MKFFKKYKLVIIVSVTIIFNIVLFFGLGYFYANLNNNNVSENTPVVSVKTVDRSVSGKNVDTDQQDALRDVQALLSAADNYDGDLDVQGRLEALDAGDYSVADIDTMKKYIRFTGEFETDTELQNTTFQALITLASLLKNSDGIIAPVSDTMYRYVFLDSELGVAYVPINAFIGSSSIFSMEMVYVEDGWKLLPYSLLDSIRLSSTVSMVE